METNDDRARRENGVVERLHGAELHRFLVRMLGQEEVAHDIVRRVCALLESAEGITSTDRRPLAFDAATRLAIEHLRAQARGTTPAGEAPPAVLSVAELLQQQTNVSRAKERLTAAIDQMDPRLRQVFVMRYVTPTPAKEIATQLRISVEEVERRLNKALRFCRERLPHLE